MSASMLTDVSSLSFTTFKLFHSEPLPVTGGRGTTPPLSEGDARDLFNDKYDVYDVSVY